MVNMDGVARKIVVVARKETNAITYMVFVEEVVKICTRDLIVKHVSFYFLLFDLRRENLYFHRPVFFLGIFFLFYE